MISCTVRYEIDPDQLPAFEIYAKAWIHLVEKLGGTHHGYHMPHEGPNDIAYCHFSFASLADYEDYRTRMHEDPDCQRAYAHARATKCIRRYDRSFTKPLLAGVSVEALGL
ncbi:NIPSNAP family protein [Sulfitobacter albidus]|uniref:NIPSNAP family protein n=1 Tax=Sulfitobacter albidus TaxID=2829501 RepID=A0A975JCY1_9RHOB|nr:NIPSNAP family protein [Sulfitobacter albidus]QUJ75795.1 NIPSNAP family protein [Sulfitobacter albidus]